MSTSRKPTATSSFGVGRREAHDATDFYARFPSPELSDNVDIEWNPDIAEPFILGDSTDMKELPDNCVALIVTSPPYFAGKQYELEVERDGIPASYHEYLEMLKNVFRECKRVLEPGGRIAVNVANLGRRPYRSLSADVIEILGRLGLLLRGEVIWQKQQGSAGNCAWGSFKSPANPVLRDITERVIIAGKDRFDRAVPAKQREHDGHPHVSTLSSDEFMAATLDVWEIEPESAKRVEHPAPFPVELPKRLIHLYTYKDDLVLDPFMGSGSTLVAAASLERRYVGYDLEPAYIEIARRRVQAAVEGPRPFQASIVSADEGDAPAAPSIATTSDDFQARATEQGKAAQKLAEAALQRAGFTIIGVNVALRKLGITVNFVATDDLGAEWCFDVSGAFTTTRAGLLRTDTVFKSLGRAAVLQSDERFTIKQAGQGQRLILLTSDLPKRGSAGDRALRAAGPRAFLDAIRMMSPEDCARLVHYRQGNTNSLSGFWVPADLDGGAR